MCQLACVQNRYSLMARWHEGLFPVLEELAAKKGATPAAVACLDAGEEVLHRAHPRIAQAVAPGGERGLPPTWPVCGRGWGDRPRPRCHRDVGRVRRLAKEGARPYALRHTFATLNLAYGENIKTVSVLMGHACSAYTLDLYAGYVPNTGLGISTRYMNYLR